MLPLNPPVFSNDVWEALADSLWQGLYELDEAKIAIVWPRFQAMKATHQDDFEIALSVLVDTASSLAEPRPTVGRTKEVLVFLVRQ